MQLSILIGALGPSEWVLVVVAVLLLFGGKKIPELMRGLGTGMKEFKNATRDDAPNENTEPGSHPVSE